MKLKNKSRIRSVFSGLNRAIIGFSFLIEFQRGLPEPRDYQKGFESGVGSGTGIPVPGSIFGPGIGTGIDF